MLKNRKCGATMRVSKIAEQQLKHHVISQVVVGRRPGGWTRDPHIRFRLTTTVCRGHVWAGQMGWRWEPREARVPVNWWPSRTGPLKALRPWEIWSKVGARWNHQGHQGPAPWTSATDQTCGIILSYRKIPQIGWFKTPLFTPSIYHKLIFLVLLLGCLQLYDYMHRNWQNTKPYYPYYSCFDGDLSLCRGMMGEQKMYIYIYINACKYILRSLEQENKNSNPFCRGFERDLSFCRGMTWKRIVSLKIVAIFLKKVNNNTPVHIVDVLAEDLSFCRGVIVGGYTTNNQTYVTYAFKTYTRHTQKSEKRERERERARARAREG